MTVTLVSYRGDAVHIVFDSGQSLTLPVKLEFSFLFSRGITITNDQYEQLSIESEKFLCCQKALAYLARSAKSVFLLKQYLKKKKFSETALSYAINAMAEKGYIDDTDYAVRFAADFMKRKKVGIRLLKSELIKKGISRQTADHALKLAGIERDDEESAWLAALKKIPSLKKKEHSGAKLWNFLRSRGFSDECIRRILNRVRKEKLLDSAEEDQF